MDFTNANASGVCFYDRLFKVFRIKHSGEVERIGGNEGGIKVRLVSPPRGEVRPFLTLHHLNSLVCYAKIQEAVQEVSDDGLTVHLHLHEESMHQVLRRYVFVFHDQNAAVLFFTNYEKLRVGGKDKEQRMTFNDLQKENVGMNPYFIDGEEETEGGDKLVFKFGKISLVSTDETDDDSEEDDEDGKAAKKKADPFIHADNSLSLSEPEAAPFFPEEQEGYADNDEECILPSLEDFSQDPYAQNAVCILPKKW